MTFWIRVFMLLVIIVSLSACGKSAKLSVKADQNEKDQPSTANVRKIEISYRDPGGKEQMRESVAAYGMGQPIAVDSDKLKDLDWDENGSFEARAYTGDGLLLLRGESKATKNDSGEVEVVLSRANSQATVSSAVIRSIRVEGAQGLSRFKTGESDLRASLAKQRCLTLPVIAMPADGATVAIVFEGAIKSPSLRYEIDGEAQGLSQEMKLNGAGDAVIELASKSQKQTIRVYSKEYEGCLDVETRLKMAAPALEFNHHSEASTLSSGVDRELMWLGAMTVHNPNDRDLRVQIRATITLPTSSTPVPFLHHDRDKMMKGRDINLVRSVSEIRIIRAHWKTVIWIYGAVPEAIDPNREGIVYREGLTVHWSVVGYDGETPISEEKRVDQIP
jgi:hypothetical protein